jgi:hypothetical protein
MTRATAKEAAVWVGIAIFGTLLTAGIIAATYHVKNETTISGKEQER